MRHADIIVRMAKNDDGDQIAALMAKKGFFQWENFTVDWSDIEPNWIAAEHEGKILGVIQVLPAKPIGRIEILAADPDLGLKTRGAVVKKLVTYATTVVKMYGAQAVCGSVPYEEDDYYTHAMKYGWIDLEVDGSVVMRRLVG